LAARGGKKKFCEGGGPGGWVPGGPGLSGRLLFSNRLLEHIFR